MFFDIILPFLQALLSLVMVGIGIEMANSPPTSPRSRWFYRGMFIVSGLILCSLTVWQSIHTDQEKKAVEAESRKREVKSQEDIGFVKGQLAAITKLVSNPPANLNVKQLASAVTTMATTTARTTTLLCSDLTQMTKLAQRWDIRQDMILHDYGETMKNRYREAKSEEEKNAWLTQMNNAQKQYPILNRLFPEMDKIYKKFCS